MANDFFGNFQEAVWNAIRSAVRVGVVGRANADGTTTVTVDGRPHYIYVRTGATNSGGEVLEAYNKGIPRLAGAPCLLIKWNRVWTVVGVDADSPAVTPTTYSVAYHQHLRDNGLAQSVHDLDGMPSSIAGRAGALLRVNEDEDGYYLADSASGGTGTVDSVNGETGDVVLDADDIAETASRIWFTTAEETKLAGIETAADVTDAVNVGSSIHGATAKTTPVDADTMPLIDSADSNLLKKVTWANIKATLKTYFDTLYVALTGDQDVGGIKTFTNGVTKFDAGAGALAYLQFLQNAVSKALIGISNGADALVVGTVSGDLAIRAANQKILLSTDDGTTVALMLSGGSVMVGSSVAPLTLFEVRGASGGLTLTRTSDTVADEPFIILRKGVTPALLAQIRGIHGGGLRFTDGSGGTEWGRFDSTGKLALGPTSPQGKLHIHDGTSGKLFVTVSLPDGTAVTVIPDGTGDVTYLLTANVIVRPSSGPNASGPHFVTPGSFAQIYYPDFGANEVRLSVSAGGAVTVQRIAGTRTYTITLELMWQ